MINHNFNNSLDDNKIQEIIMDICNKVKEFYVFPEIADKISDFLANKLNKGFYRNITDPRLVEKEISNDLLEVSSDLHFYFEYNPILAQKLLQKSDEDREDWQDVDCQEFLVAQYDNYHIVKAERLPGNIGYIRLNDFQPAECAGDVMVGALQFLANTYALIFDIRNNGGGYPSMIQLIISYLVEPTSKLINSFYERKKDKYSQSWTLPYVPGNRFPDKPVYILTSHRTASAAEEFVYNLKMMERAIVVGETTRGAAHPVDNFPILDLFVISLPIGRPINPISNDNWEGKGVTPHHQIPQEKALEKAHFLALQDLINKESDEEIKKFLEFEYEYCEAKYNGIKVDIDALKDYQGEYERSNILIQNNQIFYERANLKHPLITKDNKIFFANESFKLWFGIENTKKVLIIHRRDLPNIMRLYKTKEN
ncbi:MAG: S41 family peptidase [Candidatus Hodarchaeota archaeon]